MKKLLFISILTIVSCNTNSLTEEEKYLIEFDKVGYLDCDVVCSFKDWPYQTNERIIELQGANHCECEWEWNKETDY
jgi:hypothetical protein